MELLTNFVLRDWLLILGPVFIAGILIHGYWRMRSSRNTLKMALDKSFLTPAGQNSEDFSMLRELPNGGARILSTADDPPRQTDLNLQESVPVLMDAARDSLASQTVNSQPADELPEADDDLAVATRVAEEVEVKALPEKLVLVHVLAIDTVFNGQALLEALVEQGLTFGKMNIFHRMDASGQSIFSLVNAIEPGTFDLNTMAEIETPGVTLFLRVHELSDPCRSFKEMIDVAMALADELGGEVKDKNQSTMTSQTVEHCLLEIKQYMHQSG